MNRQVFTLMTVFLMLGALWSGAWAQNNAEESITVIELTKSNGATLDDGQYYLIGTSTSDGNFLKGKNLKIDDTNYTILDSPIAQDDLTKNNINYALWRLSTITVDNSIVGCYLINKATGGKLTFTGSGQVPSTTDANNTSSFLTQFFWFKDNKYQKEPDNNSGYKDESKSASIQLLNSGNLYLNTSGACTAESTFTFKVLTTNQRTMTAQELNNRMGDGFILAAKGFSKVEETPLLNHKLVALTFTMTSEGSKPNEMTDAEWISLQTQAKKITGHTDGSSSRTYFIYSGYDNFKKEWGENNETITDSEITITSDNIENVLNAFKAATFVAASDNLLLNTDPGFGYTFTTKTGDDLLKSGVAVSHLNAQFDVYFSYSQGSAMTVNDLNIKLKYSVFKGVKIPVSPYVMKIVDTNYLITIPTTSSQSTSFGFASSGGTVNFNHFKDKAYSITIADKKVEVYKGTNDNIEIWESKYYPDLNLINRTINPSSSGVFKTVTDPTTNQTSYIYSSYIQFGEPNDFLANKPEGQWMVTKNETPECLFLNNRESGKQFKIGNEDYGYLLYKVDDADDLYYIPGGLTGFYNDETIRVDTLRFTKQNLSGLEGYAHCKKSGDAFDPVVLKNTAYKLGIQNGTFDNSIVFVQKSSTHNNTLVVDVKTDEGLSFYLVPYDTVSYGITTPEKGYYNETTKTQPIDNLIRIKYALQERTSKRYVIYDSVNSRFMLADDSENVDKALEEAQKFFFKEKEEGQYILLPAEGWYRKKDDTFEWIDRTTEKVYANIGDAFLHKIEMYKKDIADKFGFYSTAAPMYADIMKKLKGNTPGNNDTTLFKINLYSVQNRSGNQKYMLAAGQHNFLTEGIPDTRSDIIINSKAIGGLAYDSIKFSIIVDTAYVRRTPMKFDEYGNPTLDGKPDSSSVMPLYYLGMSSTNKKENVARHDSIPVKPLPDCDKCDYYILNPKVSGNYLFVMTDSIEHGLDNIVKREDHCYHYWNTHHPRLRFVHATHEEDTMIVTSIHRSPKDTLIGGKITTKIEAMKETEWLAPQIYDKNAPNNRPNYGLFAFEVNPNPFDPEVPEYALWNPASKKYIAYVNGNLIMEDQPSFYTLDIKSEGHSIVSNEMVRTSDVRVVAAQGKVIIQNAAGKKVFLQTALGKTLADTVLTSDQEEMAAPAGIVFVTVEGEETVKTIVK